MFGTFTPESLKKFAEANGFSTKNVDFSEGIFDFKVCEKPNKERYGVPNNSKCNAPNREVKDALGGLGEYKFDPAPSNKDNKKRESKGDAERRQAAELLERANRGPTWSGEDFEHNRRLVNKLR